MAPRPSARISSVLHSDRSFTPPGTAGGTDGSHTSATEMGPSTKYWWESPVG